MLLHEKIHDDFNKLENKTRYQINKYKSLKSKKLLQDNILQLANLFKNVDIYFPVRLDQRGRLYCISSYLNYQSTSLAKSLLLFVKPGNIKRDKPADVNLLKVFGANCYGNGIESTKLLYFCLFSYLFLFNTDQRLRFFGASIPFKNYIF